MFRRRKDRADEPQPVDGDATDALEEIDDELEVDTDDAAPEVPASSGIDRSGGPFDVSEAPEDGLTRLDLGGLRVAGTEGMEIRLDVDDASQQVVAVTCVLGDSALQLAAFAAPRSEGIWDDVRREIKAGLAAAGPVTELDGPLGRELHASLPVQGPDGQQGTQPVRFVGVDGPRWFLRGLFTGRASRDRSASAPLEAVLRAVVVVRGGDPMAPGDPIPLAVPTEVPEGMSRNDDQERPKLAMPERGPEITEIR